MLAAPRPRRDFYGMERRREQAARLFTRGKVSQAEVARELQVSRQSVSRWYQSWKRRGKSGLAAAGRAGRKSRLTPRDMERLQKTLRQGPRIHGFETDLWTLPRVATVIERVMKVHYHLAHVWRILGRLDWSLQRPAKQARERDAEKVKLWTETRWPEVKKTLRGNTPGSSSKTKAGSRERPSVRRTWAPKGETPILIHSFNWNKSSVSAAIGYRWDGRRSRLIFQTIDGSYNSSRN